MEFKVSKGKTIIKEVVKANLCTGCGTCVALCPCSAIEMFKDDSKGIYLPRLNEEMCNQCGICFDICPGHSVDFKQLNQEVFGKELDDILLGNYLNCYTSYATDYVIRYNSSSGGLVTTLLIFALQEGLINGVLVTRMKRDNPLEPEPFIARTTEEIISAAGSKYCPVPANIALREILEKEGRYAVVGLPCHLHGIRKAEMVSKKLRERIALHIGIFCGTTKNFLATEFQLQRMGIQNEEVAKLDYRGEGWPGSMTVQIRNKQRKISELYYYYDNRFCSFTPWRCTVCPDQLAQLADVSFGDAWLPEVKEIDKVGTSIIISRTRQAEDILQQMLHKGAIALSPVGANKIYEAQGGLLDNKKQLKARLTISRLFGRKVPACDYTRLERPSFYNYLVSTLLYFQGFLASTRNLRWLLDIYCSLLSFASRLKSKLRS